MVKQALLKPVGRRRFMRGLILAGAGLLGACAAENPGQGPLAGQPAPYQTVTPFRAIQSPIAPTPEVTREVPNTGGEAEGSISLEEFLQFSSLLTGVNNLDPVLGRVYLQALQSGDGGGPTLADAFGAVSSGSGPKPQNLDALSEAGFFDQEGMGDLADQIIMMWYSGAYQQDDQDHVATYVDALAWKVLSFTKAPTLCGHFGFWAEEPRVKISPDIEYTPAPAPAEGSGDGG